MQGAKLIQQVKRKQKKMTGVLRKLMVVFGVFFVLLGIMISQAFMLAGFLLVALYFVFDVLSRKEYEYILDAKPPRGCGKVPQRRVLCPTAEV